MANINVSLKTHYQRETMQFSVYRSWSKKAADVVSSSTHWIITLLCLSTLSAKTLLHKPFPHVLMGYKSCSSWVELMSRAIQSSDLARKTWKFRQSGWVLTATKCDPDIGRWAAITGIQGDLAASTEMLAFIQEKDSWQQGCSWLHWHVNVWGQTPYPHANCLIPRLRCNNAAAELH